MATSNPLVNQRRVDRVVTAINTFVQTRNIDHPTEVATGFLQLHSDMNEPIQEIVRNIVLPGFSRLPAIACAGSPAERADSRQHQRVFAKRSHVSRYSRDCAR